MWAFGQAASLSGRGRFDPSFPVVVKPDVSQLNVNGNDISLVVKKKSTNSQVFRYIPSGKSRVAELLFKTRKNG
jgi:hypothetical protein